MTCMLRKNILTFDRILPRYTSYPAAPDFTKALIDQSVQKISAAKG